MSDGYFSDLYLIHDCQIKMKRSWMSLWGPILLQCRRNRGNEKVLYVDEGKDGNVGRLPLRSAYKSAFSELE